MYSQVILHSLCGPCDTTRPVLNDYNGKCSGSKFTAVSWSVLMDKFAFVCARALSGAYPLATISLSLTGDPLGLIQLITLDGLRKSSN